MNLFNLFKKQPEPKPAVSPGEVKIDRVWTGDVLTDTTTITIGAWVRDPVLDDVRAILEGKAHATRYHKERQDRLKTVGGML